MKLPELPARYRWSEVEPHRIVFRHIESGKSYGVRGFGLDAIAECPGVKSEIAYGIAKIERELERDREWLAGIK